MKANQRFRNTGLRTHALEGEHKIPLEDRVAFHGNNTKWVDAKDWKKYLLWKKQNKPERN